MRTLIVQDKMELGLIWNRHLLRMGQDSRLVTSTEDALWALRLEVLDVIILDLDCKTANAQAVADYAGYRQPKARVLFVTRASFFSDGSIFRQFSNACGIVQTDTPPEDLAAMVEHYASYP